MSEKIYSWLLRLYPSAFRARYGNEALQLFRDRLRDEKGFWPSLRLWFDLLLDFAVSLPQEYLNVRPEFAGAAPLHSANGVPSFYFLEPELLRPGALFLGVLMSSLAIVTFSILLGHTGRYPQRAGASVGQIGGESGIAQSQTTEMPNATNERRVGEFRGAAGLDDAERRRVVESAASILKQHYVDRANAEKMATSLLEHERNGDYDQVRDGAAFAAVLTAQMRNVNPDRHLRLVYSAEPLPPQPDAPSANPSAETLASCRAAMESQNCTFEKVAVLPGNIGYLRFDSFPAAAVCLKTVEEAMDSVNSTRAIIFDLRENRGGDPAMVILLAAYLFDHPEYMYNPRENTTEQSWTRSPVSGNKLADKPVFILTSASTASAAEHFTYDLKMLGRATIVGERTAGAAHSGVWHRIDDHYGMGVPETKAINPFSSADWAEVGVEPDVQVKAEDALETAVRLAIAPAGRGKLGGS